MTAPKKILIVFPEEHLAYSPTTLNIFRELKKHFDTKLVAFVPYKRSKKRIEEDGILYIDTNKWYRIPFKIYLVFYSFFQTKMSFSLLKQIGLGIYYRLYLLKTHMKPYVNDSEVIAVDFMNSWLCQQVYQKNIHFLSLEIFEEDYFFKKIDVSKVLSVIIQNQERYEYIFGTHKVKVFYVQNAPKFEIFKSRPSNERKGLLFSGAAEVGFGIYSCLDFIKQYTQYTLVLKGPMLQQVRERIDEDYKGILAEDRLVIDTHYLEQVQLNEYLNRYRIGFCFYDISQAGMDRFNYYTAPSGKLFQYHASGIPVVASNLPGLSSVSTFNAGVMVDDLRPASILEAIEKIEAHYDEMVENSFAAGKFYDFDHAIKPFVAFLKHQNQF